MQLRQLLPTCNQSANASIIFLAAKGGNKQASAIKSDSVCKVNAVIPLQTAIEELARGEGKGQGGLGSAGLAAVACIALRQTTLQVLVKHQYCLTSMLLQ